MPFPKTFIKDVPTANNTPVPNVGFLAPSVGTFILTDNNGTANFIWQHDVEDVDFHSERLTFDGIVTIASRDFYQGTISLEKEETGSEQIKVTILLSVETADADEGHRIFYRREEDSDYNLWAVDAKKFELHTPALGVSS
ncbi:hypothetical protein [Nostoc favosum]|uniref:Uncharacterized protein n=1 Tax=Nostoc favosum CHAB5714 TaxID=2780399 RepID=A0ABS8IL42_9NOSO|nr:hypothetical protein [Nostoc favosum]MCC5604884.1 hypothetical protein [Nostoc favosum CHAB5714]